ncbi:hypothetical protein H6P81_012828 [Aristolochia fimbriata]|uniref:DPH4 homolog n=1 Tax=Aristolochia fimbriata TaxID=158543 RepID=A0AAV7ECW3_ARIFI|nr:hypothetical protein H6P81_012828 [Aristolochia fimbriata]
MPFSVGLRSSSHKSYYDILSVKEDASHDHIRASYRAAVLDCHPDKVQCKLDSASTRDELKERFLEVQKAWEILSDSNTRAIYDKELKASRLDLEIVDDVQLEEMMMEEDSGEAFVLFYQCRCGDYISLSSDELSHMGFTFQGSGKLGLRATQFGLTSIILPCGSCSLKIRLILHSES